MYSVVCGNFICVIVKGALTNVSLVPRKLSLQNLKPGILALFDNLEKLPILNALLFQIGWFTCVLGGDVAGLAITTFILAVHGTFVVRSHKEWLLIAGFAVAGYLIDSGLTLIGIFDFGGVGMPLIPVWLWCLWVLFATTLSHSMYWFQEHMALAVALGVVAGPASYFAGSQLASVTLAEPLPMSLVLIGVVWAVVFPVGLLLARRCQA